MSLRAHRSLRAGIAVAAAAGLVTTMSGFNGTASGTEAAQAAATSSTSTSGAEAATSDAKNQARDKFGNVDVRANGSKAALKARAQMLRSDQEAIQKFGGSLGTEGIFTVDAITGTPSQVAKRDGFLTGPSSKRAADVAMDYVRANLDAFGLSDSDLSTLFLRKSATDVHGVTHLSWQQRVNSIPVFGNGLRAHVAKNGSLISLQGAPVAGLAAQAAAAPDADLSSTDGRHAAVADVGAKAATTTADDPSTLVYFVTPSGLRPGWSTYTHPSAGQAYQHVIDAVSGRTLYRHSTVNDDRGDAIVYDNYPGARSNGSPKASGGKARVINLFKRGYLPRNATWLRGNFAFVWADVNDDNLVQANEKTRVPGTKRAAQFALKRSAPTSQCTAEYQCTWRPGRAVLVARQQEPGRRAGAVLRQRLPDYLKRGPIGFTPQMGNFENTGGDPLLLNVLDGANTDGGLPDGDHIDNANMNTPPDGIAPTMQMYLNHVPGSRAGEDPYLPASSSNAADNIYHEYTHGLSNRLVVDAAGNSTLNSLQAGLDGRGVVRLLRDGLPGHQGLPDRHRQERSSCCSTAT